MTAVEGLKVINDPKCNKVLNVINSFKLKLPITEITRISAPFKGERLISSAAPICVNSVHFLMHCGTLKRLQINYL